MPSIAKAVLRYVIIAALMLAGTGISGAHALDIKAGRIGEHPDKMRFVLELSQNVDFRAFTLASPYRLVVDLPAFNWRASKELVQHTETISDLRRGKLTPRYSRAVLDMKKPLVIEKAFTIPAQGGKPPRLVIDYRHTDPATFRRHKSEIFGDLKIGQKQQAGRSQQSGGGAEDTNKVAASAGRGKPVRKPSSQSGKPLIILDPGHGGHDPGAVADVRDVVEKDIVLTFARELKNRLEQSGDYRVKLTREQDRFISLGKRRDLAHEHDGDLFVSLHADSIRNDNVRGASIYTLSENASDKQTARLARRENKAGTIAGVNLSHESKDVSNILIDLAMRDTMNQSKFLANTIVDKFRDHSVNVLDNSHRYAAFAVLKSADIPSVLVELGFISNAYEVRKLQSRRHRRKLAGALQAGIDAYFMRLARFDQ
jgi:N-acetylmuramoyl-L-alanine amidase